ncbi:helix-turn-helix domain-containing protein [Peptostreptococcus canis]|uniref:Helix-turn-helix domain-containing protein n=1 Tax=Peptostreptococcus canis TaxID=1159213 RepID=A0ABR6TLI6_9FIRM|nr:helix-turn-helix domain-containing protein [Peptostreptococcus canis]MBC2576276.1 helix-turn-helix domain-containing protein [Peptostreptococcus canis]
MKEGKITLTMKQLKRYQVICSYIDKQITRREAAELLSLSERQITRLKKGVVESGAEFLTHKNTGKKPVHSISNEVKEAILKIKKTNSLKNVNFLHFKEILSEEYSIEISYSSLYSILKNAEIKSPMKKKNQAQKIS